MKLKKLILIILAAIMATTLYILLFGDSKLDDNTVDKKLSVEPPNVDTVEMQENNRVNQEGFNSFEARFTGKKPAGISDNQWLKLKQSIKNLWKNIKDINYYCIVLDQFNQPIQGAVVRFDISKISEDVSKILKSVYIGGAKEKEYIDVISDEQGHVHLTGVRGDSFSVKSVIKSGYLYVPANESYGFGVGRRKPQSSMSKPVKLYAIERDASEPLYKTSFYTDLPYGENWDMNLLGQTKKNIIRENVMTLSCRQTKENHNIRDWEMIIEAIEGYEVALTDRYGYIASRLASEKLVIRNEDLNYKGHFYLFCHNLEKDHYSKIKIEVGGGRQRARIYVTTFSNPIKGSKNLAYLKEKRLRRWTGVIDPEKK